MSRHWGRTFSIHEGQNGVTHSAYVGAGPYVSFHSDADLRAEFSSYLGIGSIVRSIDEGRVLPDVAGLRLDFGIENHTYTQLAAAVTGGYRLRMPLPWGETWGRDGIYFAADYHYIHGLAYENVGLALDLGRSTPRTCSSRTTTRRAREWAEMERLTSRGGRGLAVDLGVALVFDRDAGGPRLRRHGAGEPDHVAGRAARAAAADREQPSARASAPGRSTASSPRRRGIRIGESRRRGATPPTSGTTMRPGACSRTTPAGSWGTPCTRAWSTGSRGAELRYGGVFKGDRWHPTGGLGFELSPGRHLDVAAFGTSLNPQRARRLALAVSFRLE